MHLAPKFGYVYIASSPSKCKERTVRKGPVHTNPWFFVDLPIFVRRACQFAYPCSCHAGKAPPWWREVRVEPTLALNKARLARMAISRSNAPILWLLPKDCCVTSDRERMYAWLTGMRLGSWTFSNHSSHTEYFWDSPRLPPGSVEGVKNTR